MAKLCKEKAVKPVALVNQKYLTPFDQVTRRWRIQYITAGVTLTHRPSAVDGCMQKVICDVICLLSGIHPLPRHDIAQTAGSRGIYGLENQHSVKTLVAFNASLAK